MERRQRARWLVFGGALLSAVGARAVAATTLYGLAGGGVFLVRFESTAPANVTKVVAITGLQPGERLVGIDFRPRTGQLYGIGVASGAMDTVRVYVLDAQSGAATLLPGSTGFPVTSGAAYGVAFNPTVDRIRVVNSSDENLRINPNTGARADAPANDVDLTAGFIIGAIAYDRSFDTGTPAVGRTTLYGLSFASDALVTIGGVDQNPSPNTGQVLNTRPLGIVANAIDEGFDIDVGGNAFASITVDSVNQLYAIDIPTGAATPIGPIGGGNLGVGAIAAAPSGLIAVASDARSSPRIRVLDAATRDVVFDFAPFEPRPKKGVRVALGDVNLDSVPDVIAARGKGTEPEIRVFDGATGQPITSPLASFRAFEAEFKGGLFVAAGDVNGDGFKDVIAGTGAGDAPRVKVFSGATGAQLLDFVAAEEGVTGGVQVAAADFDLDGDADIVTAAGKGGPPRVRVFDNTGNPLSSPGFSNDFNAYVPDFRGGVFVAVGDVNGDGRPDIVTGPGKGAPEVAVFDGTQGALVGRFLAFDRKVKSGVRVAVADVDGDARYEILASSGKGRATEVRAFDGVSFAEKTRFPAFEAGFRKGAFVAGVRR